MVTGITDPVSRAAYSEAVAKLLLANFQRWRRMPPEEFAEKRLRMPGEHGSTRRWSFDFFPPQRQMFSEIFNPVNREVVFKMASRLTKTMTVLGAIGYCMSEAPRKILVMWPKIGDSEEWSKKHLMGELVEPTEALHGVLSDGRGRRLGNNTILSKIFPGGYISMFGANVPGDFRRAKGNFLYADEIDAIATAESDEGDQLRQFAVRGSEYPDTVQVYCSYPSLKGQSNIDSKYDLSDKRVWEVNCCKCGDPWVMHRKDLRYDREATELATIQCPVCHALHDDQARLQMSRSGKWHPTSEFRGIAGFHANALLWPHPIDQLKYPGGFLQMLALEELAVEQSDNPERARRVLVNTRDAESYEPEHLQKIEHSLLYKRRENYDPRNVLPAEVVFITFGADLQSNRAEIKFKGWGHNGKLKQSWAIDYRVVRGSPLQAEFWEKLAAVFQNVSWKHPCGKWIHPSIGLFDSRFRPDEVFAFTRKMQRLRIYACEGATTISKPIVPKKPTKRGVPPALVWEVGTHEAKDVIYQQLEISDPSAQGYCHFPDTSSFTESYFRGLTVEESVMQRGRDGNFYRFFFKKSSDDRNEPLDAEVYANAAEQIFRPNYEKLAKEFSGEDETPEYHDNPDHGMVIPAPRMNRMVSKWLAGFGKI
jgi:phage terminase large subunit GpA-like protein